MSGLELLLTLLLPLLILVILFRKFSYFYDARRTTKLLNVPPGRLSRLPLIGDAFSFYKPHYPPSMSKFLEQRVQRYGSIFKMNIFGEPTIISLDWDFNKFVMQNEMTSFLASYPKGMVNLLGKWTIAFQTGVLHQTMRSNLSNFVNGNNLRAQLLPLIDHEARLILDSWENRSSFSTVEECKKFTFNVMAKCVLNMGTTDEELRKLRREYVTFSEGLIAVPLAIPGTSYGRALQARSVILKILDKKLEEIKEDQNEEARGGFAAIIAKQAILTRDQGVEILSSLLFAGYSTSADALSLAMYFLKLCPEAVRHLREEHCAILEAKRQKGERTLTWLDYKQMEFTHHVITETLRLGSIAKMSFRRAIRDVHYNGFDIPHGWKVIPIISSTHIDPSVYDDPLTFNPWRWKSESTSTNNKNMMAFGYGPRLCPGSELSKLEIAVFLHYLVQRYDWESTEEDSPMFFPYVRFPKGFSIRVFPNNK